MGQTLPNGIYLPAEGERNCYDGLEGNWRSLDGLISTVSGKASASHTHGNITNDGKVGTTANLPLITGTSGTITTGSFGTSANTFCEGNDSRLSDARTPVAHTHGNIANDGKLTNGNRAVITGSDKAITESSVTDTELGYVAGVTSAIQTQLNAKAADSDVVHKTGNETVGGVKTFSSLIKQSDAFSGDYTDVYQLVDSNNYRIVSLRATKGTASNTLGIYVHDQNNSAPKGLIVGNDLSNNITIVGSGTNNYLGISTNRWSAVYSDSYYYGTTAWGLDKANVWSNVNTFSNTLSITGNTLFAWDRPQVTIGTIPSSTVFYGTTRFRDSNNTSYAFERGAISTTWNYRQWFVHNFSNASINVSFEIGIKHDGTEKYFLIDADKVIPNTTGVSNLGTSDKKWKTLNGINPGALSLPDYNNVLDVTSEIPIASLDGNTQININDYLADKTGWLNIVIDDTAGNSIIVTQGKAGGSTAFNNSRTFHTGAQSNGHISVFFPIIAGMSKIAFIKASSLIQMRFYYCLGNV